MAFCDELPRHTSMHRQAIKELPSEGLNDCYNIITMAADYPIRTKTHVTQPKYVQQIV